MLLLAFLLAAGTYAAIFALYDLPAEPVAYASALTAVVFIVLGGIRFAAFRRRHRALVDLARRIDIELAGLPSPSGILEENYQALLAALFESKRKLAFSFAQKQAETEEYYTLWAHQIKTPIAAMRLMLGASDADAQLDAELLRIEQYVEMALNYVRAESETTDFLLRRVQLDEVIRACVRKYARAFVLTKTRLRFEETQLAVRTDEKWLAFCIEQLLSNALKYAAGGEIIIRAEGEALLIADTGIGIAAEDLPRAFDKGYTGYNGRADKHATGIGLYLVKKMLDKLGHTISLSSAPGRGTTARIDLSQREIPFE